MDNSTTTGPAAGVNRTTTERISDRELVVTRSFNCPARIVYAAWTKPELMMRWWVPESFGFSFISCDMDVRSGGSYRFVFGFPGSDQPIAFHGRYVEVVPNSRLVWTNEESGDDGQVTTATFTERGALTQVVIHDLYPSKEALDEALASGSTGAFAEQFGLLDEILVTLPQS